MPSHRLPFIARAGRLTVWPSQALGEVSTIPVPEGSQEKSQFATSEPASQSGDENSAGRLQLPVEVPRHGSIGRLRGADEEDL